MAPDGPAQLTAALFALNSTYLTATTYLYDVIVDRGNYTSSNYVWSWDD